MSRKFALLSVAMLAALMNLSPVVSHAALEFSAGATTGNDYEDAVLGAGHADGDIWGGEQGSDPEIGPVGPSRDEALPLINTTPIAKKPKPDPAPGAGAAGWLYQLGMMMEWLSASLRFPIA
jgi:hypothetical protein